MSEEAVAPPKKPADPFFDEHLFDEPPPPVVERLWYAKFVAFIVLANMLLIGLEAEVGCLHCSLWPQTCDERSYYCSPGEEMEFRDVSWLYLDIIFALLFSLDIAARVHCFGARRYLKGPGAKQDSFPVSVYAIIDLAVVFSRILDVLVNLGGIPAPIKIISMVRVYEIDSLSKVLKHRKGFRELHLIMAGIGDVMLTVLWVFILLLLLMWAVGCILTEAVGHSDRIGEFYYGANSHFTAHDYFGTVPRSVYTLFQILTLDRWSSQVTWPVIKVIPGVSVIFLLFICVGVLSLMSVIVGNIVECTMRSAKDNREDQERERERMNAKIMASLRMIFLEADEKKSGQINRQDLRSTLRTSHVKARLQMLQLPSRDLDLLFTLLDGDGTGMVCTDTFFRGCTRMTGEAMATDMQHLGLELNRNVQHMHDANATCNDVNAALGALLDDLDAVDRDIIQAPGDDKDEVLMARRGRVRKPRAEGFKPVPPKEAPCQELVAAGEIRRGSERRSGSKSSADSAIKKGLVSKTLKDGGEEPHDRNSSKERTPSKEKAHRYAFQFA